MTVFFYDRTFDGLLSAVFDAYAGRIFPDRLLKTGDGAPLFTDGCRTIVTDGAHAARVWSALPARLGENVCRMLVYVWLSEEDGSDELLFRYICKSFDHTHSIAWNFGDRDVLEVSKTARRVLHEVQYIKQFVRFQKTADGLFFAPVRPVCNALPPAVGHFADRFADQQWVIYDLKRKYGYFYNLHETCEITFTDDDRLLSGILHESLMAEDEKLFQRLWKGYFDAIAIRQRINPRLQRRNMPARFWQYLTEKRL
ncbi:MAG: TIGR03915 family putative DNA repair protein [Tannerella sp.]|jgi:probable DNA metabolism protein|nr:TIGR03915 family putative DNA repair protein [Tannerella sp.]